MWQGGSAGDSARAGTRGDRGQRMWQGGVQGRGMVRVNSTCMIPPFPAALKRLQLRWGFRSEVGMYLELRAASPLCCFAPRLP